MPHPACKCSPLGKVDTTTGCASALPPGKLAATPTLYIVLGSKSGTTHLLTSERNSKFVQLSESVVMSLGQTTTSYRSNSRSVLGVIAFHST